MQKSLAKLFLTTVAFLPSCRTIDASSVSESSPATAPCPHIKAFTLEPLPGQIPGDPVTADDDGRSGSVVSSDFTYFFRYCPDEDKLHSVTKWEDRSGLIDFENSLSPRFSAMNGLVQAFEADDSRQLKIILESRNLKVEGATIAGKPVVFVGPLEDSPFARPSSVGRLVPIADIPRPLVGPNEPLTQAAFLTCDAGTDVQSFSDAEITRGEAKIKTQLDVCLDSQDTVRKSAILLVIESKWNDQIQTEVIQIQATEQSGAEKIIFGNINESTRLVFKSDQPLGRSSLSKVSLSGQSDGSLNFAIDDVAVEPVTMAFGALSSPDGCLPGEELKRSSLKFDASSGSVVMNLVACEVFEFGATGTIRYRFKEIEIVDPDPRLSVRSRSLKGDELKAHSRLSLYHHNACDKLEIFFDDVQYGFTAPDTFSIGNHCQEDVGVAPPNDSSEILAIRKRLTAGLVSESLTIPWGKGLTYAPKLVLSPDSDPLE